MMTKPLWKDEVKRVREDKDSIPSTARQVLAHWKDEVKSIREDKGSPLRLKTSIDLCRNHPPNIGELLY